MATSRKKYRQDVGRELGIIKPGTTSASTTTTIVDTTQDSPMDAGDQAARYNGVGVFINDGTNLHYRQNAVYTPSSQTLTLATVSGLTGVVAYEIHTETLIHPLTDWPVLINEGLRRIRRLSFQAIYLSGRNYYDLTDWADLTHSSQFRRLYYVGANLLRNVDFSTWNTGDDGPDSWTASAALGRVAVTNYAQRAQCGAAENLYQDIQVGYGGKRIKVSVWAEVASGGTATLKVDARLADASSERNSSATVTAETPTLMSVELELTSRTKDVRVTLSGASANCDFWTPMAYVLSRGVHQRIQPVSAVLNDRVVRLWTPGRTGVGELALLLPEEEFTLGDTSALDVATVDAPYELAKASILVQVLRFLVQHPDIPLQSKKDYIGTLITWQGTFNRRIREYHRKLAKTPMRWEAGELN